MARIRVVVLNYKTPELTIRCLASIADEVVARGDTEVVVTDNASGDGSPEKIGRAIVEHGWGSWASVMALPHNGGFAYGNNEGVRAVLGQPGAPEYYHLLNPDTEARGLAVGPLVDFLERHPAVGIVGSRLEDPDGTPQRTAYRFHSVLSELDNGLRLGLVSRLIEPHVVAPPVPVSACETDWVCGASLMVRRRVFEEVGLMDEAYFLYFEETDFCYRAKQKGWSCWYVPESRVMHLMGASTEIGDSRRQAKRRPPYWFESRRRFFVKNFGPTSAALADFVFVTGLVLWRARAAVQQKPVRDPPQFLRDFVRHSVLMKGTKIEPPR